MSTDWRALCAELADALDHNRQCLLDDRRLWSHPLADKARAALAQPEPEVVGPTLQLPEQAPDEHPPSNLDRREVAAWYHGHACGWQAARTALAAEADGPAVQSREPASVACEPSDEELLELWQGWNLGWDPQKGIVLMPHPAEYARAVLARFGHQPAPPAEGEVTELARLLRLDAHLDRGDGMPQAAARFDRAADLLEQRHPAPVPVTERLPGPGDCDAEGRCWWGRPESDDWSADWTLATPEAIAEFCEFSPRVTWLPFNALPLPGGEVE